MATVRHLGLFPGGCPSDPPDSPAYNTFFANARMGLREMMDFTWRVRRWKFELSAPVAIGTYTNPEFTSEKALVCGTGIHSFDCELSEEGGSNYRRVLLSWQVPNVYKYSESQFMPEWLSQTGFSPDSFERTGYLTFLATVPAGTFTMSPLEWWPYDPGDGLGPIYDTATGKQLRAFPN